MAVYFFYFIINRTSNGVGLDRSVLTIDPRNVEHILKSNFFLHKKSIHV